MKVRMIGVWALVYPAGIVLENGRQLFKRVLIAVVVNIKILKR